MQIAEHLRLPLELADLDGPERAGLPAWSESVRTAGGRCLLWPRAEQLGAAPLMTQLAAGHAGQIPICARLLDDDRAQALLVEAPGDWSAVVALEGPNRERVGSIWRDAQGNVLLPFDPDEVLLNYWREDYVNQLARNGRGRGGRAMLRLYYRVRTLLPRPVQIWLRRRYARVQARTPFPRWPVESALHDFIDLFLAILTDVAGGPVPYIAPWPDGYDWALVLTHDVETAAGLTAMEPVLEIEREHGLRSSWYFVPRRYSVPPARIESLGAEGFEVGVHGLYHDGRDLSSLPRLRARLPAMREAASRWGAVGFRSPASHRRWEWMPLLGFDYDSSYPDTDPFEPQRGGCCSWWPFFNEGMVELPLTMPHDHTLFVILGHRDESIWVHKAELLRRRGGMALIVTHPDYLRDPEALASYRRLLERYALDPTAWKPLPAELSRWWRRRAQSEIVCGPDGWEVKGPAAASAHIRWSEFVPWC